MNYGNTLKKDLEKTATHRVSRPEWSAWMRNPGNADMYEALLRSVYQETQRTGIARDPTWPKAARVFAGSIAQRLNFWRFGANVVWHYGFTEQEMRTCHEAMAKARELIRITFADLEDLSRRTQPTPVRDLFRAYFGNSDESTWSSVKNAFDVMRSLKSHGKPLLLFRTSLTSPSEQDTNAWTSDEMDEEALGTGKNHFKCIYIGDPFFNRSTARYEMGPLEQKLAFAQTLLHEISHATAFTKDEKLGPRHAYGRAKCRGLAQLQNTKPDRNADSVALFAVDVDLFNDGVLGVIPR
jgi:hypothetical protein